MDGIRRKMKNREIGLFWFGFGLCCACDIEEDGRRKS